MKLNITVYISQTKISPEYLKSSSILAFRFTIYLLKRLIIKNTNFYSVFSTSEVFFLSLMPFNLQFDMKVLLIANEKFIILLLIKIKSTVRDVTELHWVEYKAGSQWHLIHQSLRHWYMVTI